MARNKALRVMQMRMQWVLPACVLVAVLFSGGAEGHARQRSGTAPALHEDNSNETFAEQAAEATNLTERELPKELLDEAAAGPEIAMLFLFIALLMGIFSLN
jgi:hypothetical protein